jgi:hypothetical protein
MIFRRPVAAPHLLTRVPDDHARVELPAQHVADGGGGRRAGDIQPRDRDVVGEGTRR